VRRRVRRKKFLFYFGFDGEKKRSENEKKEKKKKIISVQCSGHPRGAVAVEGWNGKRGDGGAVQAPEMLCTR
jgi:hypothetical protein